MNSATGIWTDTTPAEPDTLAIGNDLNDAGTVAIDVWPSEGYAYSLLRRANGTTLDVVDDSGYPIIVSKINNWEDLIGFNGLPVARVDGNFFYSDPAWWDYANFTDINDQGEVLGTHDIYDELSGNWTYETFVQTAAGVSFVTGAPDDFLYYALTGEVNWGRDISTIMVNLRGGRISPFGRTLIGLTCSTEATRTPEVGLRWLGKSGIEALPRAPGFF